MSRSFARQRSTATADVPYILHTPLTKITTLDSGLRVATEESFGTTATVGVFIDSGSVYENEENNGTAHFLEHMAFKGTSRRTQEGIEIEVENMGGQLNAYTSREQTVYFGKSLKTDVPKMLDIISDILQNSKLEERHIERERHVILKEKQVVESEKEEVIFDFLHTAAFQGTPLANTILGETKNIKSIQKHHLQDFIRTHYIAPRMVVVGSGGVNHEELVKLASESFKSLPTTSDYDYSHLAEIEYTGSEITVNDNTTKHVHGAVAFRGPSWSNPDYIPFIIIQNFIGSWDSSMGGGNNLTSNLSEVCVEYNLAESFSAFSTCYNRTGLFGVNFVANYEKADDFSRRLMEEVCRARSMTQEELDRIKSRVKAAYLLQLDGSTPVFEDIGRQVLALGRRMTPLEILERIDKVTLKDIKSVCNEYLRDVDPVVAAYGNLKYFPDYNNFRSWTTAL